MDLPVSPLLEFDEAPTAFVEPTRLQRPRDVPPACVVTFFSDVVDRLVEQGRARLVSANRWEDGPHPVHVLEHPDGPVTLLQCGVGAPLAAGLLEGVIAMGCRAFVVCGGAGALRAEIPRGPLVVVTSALRDEGTSHHYAPAARTIDADPAAAGVLQQVLGEQGLPFVAGRTWTTDAPYRETVAKIASRREEGCLVVDMEAAALIAVAAFRGVPLAQVVYGGDDLSGEVWDQRSWQRAADVRDGLVALAGTAALRLAGAGS